MKITPRIENLVVLRDSSRTIAVQGSNNRQAKGDNDLLRLMVCNEPFAKFVLGCLTDVAGFCGTGGTIAIPQEWVVPDINGGMDIVRYTQNLPVCFRHTGRARENSWVVVSDGRVLTLGDNQRIYEILADIPADVIAVNVVAQLRASYEKVLTTSHSELVGFRLFYEGVVQPSPLPDDWPHHLFVKAGSLNKLLTGGSLPLAFDKLLELCYSKSLVVHSVSIGGSVLDLTTEGGLLELVQQGMGSIAVHSRYCEDSSPGSNNKDGVAIASSARLFGKILLGKGVNVGEDAIIVGPTVVGNDVKIGRDAVVRASVIGPGVSVQAGEFIEARVLTNSPVPQNGPVLKTSRADAGRVWGGTKQNSSRNNFREWPKFSYASFVKRIFDIVVSAVVLILFAPVLPIIMLVIKLTSPGSIFFKDTRQGLHGKAFECLKFRTMRPGAHRMQDRLRVLNRVDGPQFVIEDDPRLSAVGKFLRETYLDEIPQFVNVLLGQMSVVGPRPSPESENRLCPFWRDARLSVRPGITGLWQICRTRKPMRDFQEWIHYDIKYVRELSLKLDLWICWQTAKKMAARFVSQF